MSYRVVPVENGGIGFAGECRPRLSARQINLRFSTGLNNTAWPRTIAPRSPIARNVAQRSAGDLRSTGGGSQESTAQRSTTAAQRWDEVCFLFETQAHVSERLCE